MMAHRFPIEFVRALAWRTPEAPAATNGTDVWSYSRLLSEVDAMAAALQDMAGTTRPRVAVCGNNTLDHATTVLAVHASGGVLIPINARSSDAEVAAQIGRVEPHLIFTEKKTAHLFETCTEPLIAGAPFPEARTTAAELRRAFAGQTPTWPDVSPDDVNGIKFTGGTSGTPKAVEQSFRCVVTLIRTMIDVFGFDAGDRHLCVAPISHGAGTFMVPILATGGVNHLVEDPKPAHVLDLLERGAGTTTFLPPTLIYAIMDAAGGRRPDFAGLRHLIYGAAPMPPEKVIEARRFFKGKLEAVYGQTEMPVVMSVLTADDMADDANIASAGRITPDCTVEIMDPDGVVLPPNAVGEIVGKGDLMMNGYYRMPEETAMTIVDGWLHTGDIGYIDDRGFLFIKDRLRDVIISGGFNVYPIEVEDALVQHPSVRECVVFSAPDDKWGERVEAALEIYPHHPATEDEIIAFAKTLIGSVKAPKRVHISQSLPRSPVGKVVRTEARAWALSRGEAEA
ncbi:MAG: AMP-binding protein [Roseitalea sp.]|jgi:acyl-CoA synthetase (AMP-forming)/AMP-acid ligase II|nr:AMP-binding protein [Roseitalea sp.]MBO6721357.1 AMP-binding protein [Roseitalea sp.]